MKPVIIELYDKGDNLPNKEELESKYEVIRYHVTTKEKFFEDIQHQPLNEAVAIFAGYPGFKAVGGLHEHSLIDFLPSTLKVIGLCSAGMDGLDVAYLNAKGIQVTNVPVDEHIAMDVADCALWHVLNGVRKFNYWDHLLKNAGVDGHTLEIRENVRNHYTDKKASGFAFGHLFHGKEVRRSHNRKCVVLGYGLIGKQVVNRMLVIGMDINVVVRNPEKYQTESNPRITIYSSKDLVNATKGADVIVICLPGCKETNDIINEEIFHNLNDNAIIVNVGRGSCIDTKALQNAIESGKVAHTGLDVFPNEPIVERYWLDEHSINNKNPFFTSSITPHLGSSTSETLDYANYSCVETILSILQDK